MLVVPLSTVSLIVLYCIYICQPHARGLEVFFSFFLFSFGLLVELGVLYMLFLAVIYIGGVCYYFAVCLRSVLTSPTRTPPSRSLIAWAVNGDLGLCKISVKNLARETRLAGFATLRPFKICNKNLC